MKTYPPAGKRPSAAMLRELRLMVKERVLSSTDVRTFLGIPTRLPLPAPESVTQDEADRLFRAVYARIEEQRRAALERERLQRQLPFGGN